jgi:hypothetical protein
VKPGEKDAAGRVLAREMRGLERFLFKRRVPEEEVRDVVCLAIVITWEKLATGQITLPTDPKQYGAAIGRYLFGVVRRVVANRTRASEIMVRGRRTFEGVPEKSYRIDAAIELASELRAQPPNLRRFLLSLMGIDSLAETARRLRMSESAAEDAFRRAREHAQGIRRAPRGKNRKK